MKKIKLEDVNILINEYDEIMVKLQRDDQNVQKNAIFSFLLSLFPFFFISKFISNISRLRIWNKSIKFIHKISF